MVGENGVRRKSFDEVHELLLTVALDVFAERGYSGTTTSEIARKAGASEPLLFRHFGSKSGLFEAAVITPFSAFVNSFTEEWTSRTDPHQLALPVYEFTSWAYRELRRHRSLALALLGLLLHDDGPDVDRAALRRLLDQCVAVIDHEARLRGWTDVDVPVATRLMLGMILWAALFKDWFFEALPDAGDEQIVDQLVALVLKGVDRADGPVTDDRPTIREERNRARVVITAREQATALAAAADWAARRGVRIESISWSDSSLRIYYEP